MNMKNQFYLKSFKNIATFFLAACAIVFLFAGCGKTEDPGPKQPSAGIALIQMADPLGANSQDVYINSYKGNSIPFAYGTVLGYYAVAPGSTTVEFRNTGTSATTATTSVNTVVDNFYTVVFGDNNTILYVADDQTLPQAGKARIRFLNVSSYLNSNVDFGGAGGNKLVLNSPVYTTSGYYEVDPSATTSITVYPTGNSTASVTTNVSMTSGHVYYYIVSGTTSAALQGKLFTQL